MIDEIVSEVALLTGHMLVHRPRGITNKLESLFDNVVVNAIRQHRLSGDYLSAFDVARKFSWSVNGELDPSAKARALDNCGRVLHDSNNFPSAKNSYEQALGLLDGQTGKDIDLRIASLNSNLGSTLTYLAFENGSSTSDCLESAKFHLGLARGLYLLVSPGKESFTSTRLAEFYLAKNEPCTAGHHTRAAKSIEEKNNNLHGLVLAMRQQARVYLSQGTRLLAQNEVYEALEIIESLPNAKRTKMDLLLTKAEVEQSFGLPYQNTFDSALELKDQMGLSHAYFAPGKPAFLDQR